MEGCLDIFTLLYLFSSLSPSLWETARYRLKYCLKGPLNQKQPNNPHRLMTTKYFVLVFLFIICIKMPQKESILSNIEPQYRPKYCLKGAVKPKTTNQPIIKNINRIPSAFKKASFLEEISCLGNPAILGYKWLSTKYFT